MTGKCKTIYTKASMPSYTATPSGRKTTCSSTL